jgi:predicted acylesterase/phospholipase RssA
MERGDGKLDRIYRRDIFDLNIRDFLRRCGSTTLDVLRAKHTPSSAMAHLVPSGVFAGERLREYLERQFAKPGMTDSFAELQRPLYIGATDQDTAEHVIFGAGDLRDVPISLAVRASVGLTPFYAPQKIGDRYYADGGFTRTTNMRVAVQAGATMVILIDPLIPVYSEQPGYVQAKGALFSAAQGLKALINSRFDKAVNTLREMYPQVTFHLFQPDGATMKAMSGSPMKYFYRPGIEELSFRETVRDIRGRRFEVLARDFARHGIRFVDPDVRRADAFDGEVQVA